MASNSTCALDLVSNENNDSDTDPNYRSGITLTENSVCQKNLNKSCLKRNDECDTDNLSRKQIKLSLKTVEMDHSKDSEQTTLHSNNIDSEMTYTSDVGCSTSNINVEGRSHTHTSSTNKTEEESNVEPMNTNESSSASSSPSSSTLSSSELEDLPVENDDNSRSSSSLSSITSTSSSSDNDDDDVDFRFISWSFGVPVDGDSSNDEPNSSPDQHNPEVLKKTLPADKFSFVKALTERQWKEDDVRRRFANRFDYKVYGSRKLVQRLALHRKLQTHKGSVNCVTFNDAGNVLISGSDDRHVCLWDWSRGKSLLYFDSGHVANVFQAKFLPTSGDTKLVTCGQDNQIRMCLLDQCGLKNTSMIIRHARTVHKLALQRQMPNTFLSAGEDGVVYSIDIRDWKPYCTKLTEVTNNTRKSPVTLYSIHCNPIKNYEFIVCGNDEEIRLFDQRNITVKNPKPVITFAPANLTDQNVYLPKSVTCALFNYNGTEVLSSYNNNTIYLFDAQSGKEVHCYDGHRNFETVKGVNFYGPRNEYIVSGSDCGHVFMWDKNSEAIVQWMRGDKRIVNCLEPHPAFPILATSGMESDIKIWTPTKDVNDIEDILQSEKFQRVTKKNSGSRNLKFSRCPPSSFFSRAFFSYGVTLL